MKKPITIQIETTTISKLNKFCGTKIKKVKQAVIDDAINEYIDSRVTNRA